MTTPPTQPPEGALIETARARRVPPVSMNHLAKLAGITGPRWRQIENGYSKRAGVYVRENAPDDTLARMAHAVGLGPKDLREVGRSDAADWLDNMLGANDDSPPVEITRTDTDGYEAFQAAVEGTPPELRDFALRLAIQAVEAIQEAGAIAAKGSERTD